MRSVSIILSNYAHLRPKRTGSSCIILHTYDGSVRSQTHKLKHNTVTKCEYCFRREAFSRCSQPGRVRTSSYRTSEAICIPRHSVSTGVLLQNTCARNFSRACIDVDGMSIIIATAFIGYGPPGGPGHRERLRDKNMS